MKPLKFHPLLRETIWGGSRIASFKQMPAIASEQIGESWELSVLEGAESRVRGGAYDGMTLREVIRRCGCELLGERLYKRFGEEFPLLVKFIDAHQDLSIQVHPNDELARELHGRGGKCEMWYVIDAEPGSRLYCGLKQPLTPESYDEVVREGRIMEYLQSYEVKSGDLFYLPAGRIHSIGAGILVAELQQSCDLTYRVYDFDRRDKQGNLRPLHIAEARRAIDYRLQDSYQTPYTSAQNCPVELVATPHFTADLYDLTRPLSCDLTPHDSFHLLMILQGEGTLLDSEGNTLPLRRGESLLLPASTRQITLSPSPCCAEPLKLLSCYIK